jgi:hypothetical protein
MIPGTCLCRHEPEEHNVKKDRIIGACLHKNKYGKIDCSCKKYQCGHWRIKKNYSHGKKSGAEKVCKDCGEIVINKFLEKRREK